MIGQEQELEQIKALLQEENRPVLLTGPTGIGKTAILKYIAETSPNALYIERIMPIKPALLTIIERLYGDKNLEITEVDVAYLSWQDLLKRVNRLNVAELTDIVLTSLDGKEYLLLLDNLEDLSIAKADIVEKLMEKASILAATSKKKWSLQRLLGRFDEVEVPPLSRAESRELLWQTIDRDSVPDPKMLESHILFRAAGNPGGILAMAQNIFSGEEISLQQIRNLKPPAEIERYLNLTPVVLLFGVGAVFLRYLGLAKSNIDWYIIGGVGTAMAVILRYLAYRSMRQDRE